MSVGFQVTFDAADPLQLGRFWAEVLGYVDQPPPAGFDSWDAFLDSIGVPAEQRDGRWAVVDPDGVRPRLLFQKVPEDKIAKNRMHLDVHVGAGIADSGERRRTVRARADQLVGLGANELREAEELGEYWIVLQDPEGNEFCVQ
jgi:Glyoxalase-like domain